MLKLLLITLTLFFLGCDKKIEPKPEQDKVNMIFITQVGCGACEQIKGYMKKPDIKAILDKDFIVKEVDITNKEDFPFKWMQPYATPTLYFFDKKDHEIIDHTVRRMSEKDFTDTLEEVIDIRDMD
ncbi:MAG TPA: hypothetical protein EYH01_10555 [Campylobacterales bacterium]|nr:hypothetical protein [Campylobacterales bacterium]